MSKYVIKNKKRNIYYKLDICKNNYHFVADIKEAKVFETKKEANTKVKELSIVAFEVVKI